MALYEVSFVVFVLGINEMTFINAELDHFFALPIRPTNSGFSGRESCGSKKRMFSPTLS